jgi:hypothetical protein
MNKLLSSLTLLLVLGGTAHASTPPRVLTEEGRLAGADGTPSTGAATLTFAVYDAPTGGTALWSETQTVTLGADGYFAAQLGLGQPLPAEAFDGPTRYLGIRVDGEAEMTPRQVVSSVPYALLAGDVSGDIHPTSIVVNGQTIVDAQGNWVGPTTGLQGPQGPQGETGPSGVVAAPGFSGSFTTVSLPPGILTPVGPSTTFVATAGQTISFTARLSVNALNNVNVQLVPCAHPDANVYSSYALSNGSSAHTIVDSFTVTNSGSITLGVCANNGTISPIVITSGSVSGLAIVTN